MVLYETRTSPFPLLCYKVHLIESTLPKENKMVILACRSKRTLSFTDRCTASLKSLEARNDRWANLRKMNEVFHAIFSNHIDSNAQNHHEILQYKCFSGNAQFCVNCHWHKLILLNTKYGKFSYTWRNMFFHVKISNNLLNMYCVDR